MTQPQGEPSSANKLAAALEHARSGFSVFPIIENGKKPAIANWQNLATSEPERIRAWWTENPGFNIGIPTSNYLVVDIDPRNGGRESFARFMTEINAQKLEVPKTTVAKTQGGGSHVIFALPHNTVIRGGSDKLGKGVDVKSWGGYIVAPGSSIEGRPYVWGATHVAGQRPARAPDWLIERCKVRRARGASAGVRIAEEDETAVARAREYVENRAPEAHEGERDNTAYKVAAACYDYGTSRDTVLGLLYEWSELKCWPPLPDEDLERIAGSAEHSRENAIGVRHPSVSSGFEAVEIGPAPSHLRLVAANDVPLGVQPSPERSGIYDIPFQPAAKKATNMEENPLVKGLLERGGMSIWYGESGSGKSFVALNLAWHIAAGRPWVGMDVHQGPVTHVATEGGRGIFKRCAALRNQYQTDEDVPLFIIPCPVDLLHRNGHLAELVALIKPNTELIIIDTLSRAMAGGDENSPVDMGEFVKQIDALRKATGAHVALIHHTGKDKARGARGHSLLRAATDTEIEINEGKITATKQRDIDEITLRFQLRPCRVGFSPGGDEITSCTVDIRRGEAPIEAVALSPRMVKLVEGIDKALGENPEQAFSWEFVADVSVGIGAPLCPVDKCPPRTTILRWMSELSESGAVKKDKRGKWVRVNVQDVQ